MYSRANVEVSVHAYTLTAVVCTHLYMQARAAYLAPDERRGKLTADNVLCAGVNKLQAIASGASTYARCTFQGLSTVVCQTRQIQRCLRVARVVPVVAV